MAPTLIKLLSLSDDRDRIFIYMTNQKIEKILKILIFIGLLGLITIIFSQKIELTSIDLGRHLENGKIIWQNPQVLFTNFYSYTAPLFPFINHHWLAGVIFFLVYQLNGFISLAIFNVIIALISFSLFFNLAKKKIGFYITALLSIPIIFLLSERVQIRPEIFSYLFIALTWYILERASEKRNYRLVYGLIPIFILWVNIHSYFFLGLALIGFKATVKFITPFLAGQGGRQRLTAGWSSSKNYFLALIIIALACLINPNFLNGWLYPFNIFHELGYDVIETHSVFDIEKLIIDYNIPLFKFYLLLLTASWITYWLTAKKLKLFNLLITILFTSLALLAIRNITIFALVSLVIISDNLAWPVSYLRKKYFFSTTLKRTLKLSGAVVILIIIISGTGYLMSDEQHNSNFIKSTLGWGLRDNNDGVARFFNDHKLSGPIFNNYDIGSALIFWLYPQEKVFIDNRPEAYDPSFFTNIYQPMQLNKDKWQELSQQYKFKTIIFTHTDYTLGGQTFLQSILTDPDWTPVYFDYSSIIFLNKLNNDKNLIERLTLSKEEIANRIRTLAASTDLRNMNQLAYLANLTGQVDLATEISYKILSIYPNNRYALSSLGLVYFNDKTKDNLLKALDFFNKSAQAGNKLPGIYNRIGLIYQWLGDYQQAENNFNKTLKIDKKNEAALYYLSEIKKNKLYNKIWLDNNFPAPK